jgi:S1-C subfamily serine protease
VPWLARALRLNTENGIYVVSVIPSSSAAAGGIRGASEQVRVGNYLIPAGGDVIVAIEGRPVSTGPELTAEIDRHKPGDRVTVTVLRGNRRMDLPVVLQEAPNQ